MGGTHIAMKQTSDRIGRLPLYAVSEIAEAKRRLLAEGVDVIDVGAGDADFHPPQVAVEALREALSESSMSRYSFQVGLPEYRERIVEYMQRRFSVAVDPLGQVLPLLGSKDGLSHFALAVLNPGDICIVPEPGYPAYFGGTAFADSELHVVPLNAGNDFLVNLEELPEGVLRRARMAYLNYPNNPTAAVAPREYLRRVVEVCLRNEIVLAYDNPYVELGYDDYRAPSILEIEGASEIAVEFHSLSKSFGMTGWRIGFAVGNKDLLAALSMTKSYFDTGPFLAVQKAAAAVLASADICVQPVRSELERRRNSLVNAFRSRGFEVDEPRATMYQWVELPESYSSAEFARDMLEKDGLAVLPGSAMGESGEGFVRFAFTVGPERLGEAADRFAAAIERWQTARAHT